jgi:hypothetical protein
LPRAQPKVAKIMRMPRMRAICVSVGMTIMCKKRMQLTWKLLFSTHRVNLSSAQHLSEASRQCASHAMSAFHLNRSAPPSLCQRTTGCEQGHLETCEAALSEKCGRGCDRIVIIGATRQARSQVNSGAMAAIRGSWRLFMSTTTCRDGTDESRRTQVVAFRCRE